MEDLFREEQPPHQPRAEIPGEAFEWDLIEALLVRSGEPHSYGVRRFKEGIRVGVGYRMPRTRAVWERKTNWRKLDSQDGEPLESKGKIYRYLLTILFNINNFKSYNIIMTKMLKCMLLSVIIRSSVYAYDPHPDVSGIP